MTTRGTTPRPGALVDAPALHLDRLSDHQRTGRSCCWCSGTPDSRFPVRLGTDGADLRACPLCAGMYGVPAVDAGQ
ncbi:hypothetical protein AQI95_41820 [Streptomyces yokosukanensis]|uniref:Uncharacterized protein n=1 Tax=Streptomyces yokosukanensis TaxID=67386 RepID=A0A101NQ81_9ACTN|nr:hypothetical protein [Streptomyces yokosukanensis]KUM97361.1 hypothetical protein AQI95_41820 [Streptomyces yokosukanensis]